MTPHRPPTILFDIGGVLTPDPWETILLTPHTGAAALLGVPANAAQTAGESLWAPVVCDPDALEGDWWRALSAVLGLPPIPRAWWEQVTARLLVPAPGATALLRAAHGAGVRIGIVSNNTAFWYPRQVQALSLGAVTDPGQISLSHADRVDKGHGLFDVAVARLSAAGLEPGRALMVEDRAGGAALARAAGLRAYLHAPLGSLDPVRELLGL